jgi:hypothetical protein
MSLFGTHLTILAGLGVPLPLPSSALEALDSIEISSGTSERSGMQAQFKAGRGSNLIDIADYPIMNVLGLKAGSRIIVLLTLGIVPQVMFDGIVTQSQLNPGQGRGDGTFAVSAEDIRVKMDQTERDESYPGMPVAAIAALVMARYARHGLVPTIIPPLVSEVPLPMDRVTTQSGSDLSFLNELAQASDYIFTVTPGPAPGMNMGYFGPQPRLGMPQSALTINMGPDSNVSSINFQQNATDAHQVVGDVQDRTTNTAIPVRSIVPLRVPLATEPAILNLETAGERRFRPGGPVSAAVAMAQAQATADRSTDVLTAEGELDGSRYGKVLQPRQLVGLRGAGRAHDGLYFVNEVKHMLKRGEYKQHFKLTREGTGTTTPFVLP